MTDRPPLTGYIEYESGRRVYHPGPADATYAAHADGCARCGAERVRMGTEPQSQFDQLMAYVDEAKRAAGTERVSGEPLAAFITRMLEEVRELREEVEARRREMQVIR